MATIDRRGAAVSAADPPIGTNPNADLAIKAPARAATTGSNIALSGLFTLDGIALAAGDRVLVKDQTDARNNGLYNAATGPWTRTIDAANNLQWAKGLQVTVTDGAVNGTTSWECTATSPIMLGTSALTWTPGAQSTRNVNTTAPLAGGGALTSDLTLSLNFGGTLALVGNALQTAAGTGDVAWTANSFVTSLTWISRVPGKTLALNNSLTLAGTDGKTAGFNNSLTFAGTDGTTLTFQGTDTYVGRATTDALTNKTFDSAGAGNVLKLNGSTITGASSILDLIGSTRGSVLFRGATGWSILPPGNSGLVLTSNGAGADPTYQAGGTGAMALLNTLSASNSATLSDTTSLTSTYNAYELVFSNVIPATNSVQLVLQVHSGGSFQTTSYIAAGLRYNGGGSGLQTSATNIPLSYMGVANTGPGVSGSIRVYNPSQTASPKNWAGVLVGTDTTSNPSGLFGGGFWNGGNGAVDGFQVFFSSGNITSGTIKIYGIT